MPPPRPKDPLESFLDDIANRVLDFTGDIVKSATTRLKEELKTANPFVSLPLPLPNVPRYKKAAGAGRGKGSGKEQPARPGVSQGVSQATQPTVKTAYDYLGVNPDADPEVVKGAYRALCRKYHPDNGTEPNQAIMTIINLAYDVLKSPEKRKSYNKSIGLK